MADTFRPYEGTDPYIFVSYARKDADRVLPILAALDRAGYRIWYDAGIHWTEEWPDEIAVHLAGSAVCLAFHSEASSASPHCKAEILYARSKKRPILSAYLAEEVQLPPGIEMYLTLYQSVKLSQFADIAAFVARMDREPVFAPCKAAPKTETPPVSAPEETAPPIVPAAKIEPLPVSEPKEVTTPPAPPIVSVSNIETPPVSAPKEAPTPPASPIAWKKDDTIQWYLDRDGVLTIAKNEDLSSVGLVPMPNYKRDTNNHSLSTAPWIPSREKIRSVVIRDDIDTIGSRAFGNCVSLTSVTIPDSVTSISDWAFYGCMGLISMTIPSSVIFIGKWAFFGCASLTNVTIPDSMSYIGTRAFHGCAGLTSVTIPVGARFSISAFPYPVRIIRRPPRWKGS